MRRLGTVLMLLGLFASRAGADDVIPVEALARLVSGGYPVCTGFVADSRLSERNAVYRNLMVTAGHCLPSSDGVKLVRGHGWGYKVVAYSSEEYWDLAVIQFSSFSQLPALSLAFDYEPRVGDRLTLVGFGRGALMARVGEVREINQRGLIAIWGYASPGNSGGPVLIPGTKRVVGVAIMTTVDIPKDSLPPGLYCGPVGCRIIPPYYATPARHLAGMLTW